MDLYHLFGVGGVVELEDGGELTLKPTTQSFIKFKNLKFIYFYFCFRSFFCATPCST
jgi:hypothetical protein